MKKYDVVALGELLIDFTENGVSAQGNPLLEANPGGAPCNVLAMVSKLGYSSAFLGKVGNDQFGAQLKTAIEDAGIDSRYLLMDEHYHTTLAFVHKRADGDRDFSFYRNPGADMMYTAEEVPQEAIRQARIFHFGTLSMTHEGVRAATKKAVETAEQSGCLLSFDPNLRPPLWNSLEEAREQVLWGLSHCQVLKISDEEITWLTGRSDYTEGVQWIRRRFQIPLILVTLGKDGSRAYVQGQMVEEAPFLTQATIETTGAGDTFMGCVLGTVLEKGIQNLTESELRQMLRFANGAASMITTRKGALKVMPERTEILELIRNRSDEG